MRRLLPLSLLLVASAVVLGGCASADPGPDPADGAVAGSGGAGPGTGSGSGISRAENDLRIEVDLGDAGAPQTWTLTCVAIVEGTHPRAEDACAHLDGMTDPFAPLPEDQMCSQQYAGPETAHITGRWRGEPVDLELSRVDGCRISQWDSFGPVLPVPVGGVEPLG